jgi:2-oxoglutarate ferredoxin oxidoreductase subunit alpha
MALGQDYKSGLQEFIRRESRHGALALGQERVRKRVNDFSINVATVNGSGSQSANSVLLRSIFGMGVPVSGQEPVPLQHRRTAHLVHHPRQQRRLGGAQARHRCPDRHEPRDRARRCSRWLRRRRPSTTSRSTSSNARRPHVCYPVPFDKLTAATGADAKLRKLVKNMVYVGVAAQLLSIDMEWWKRRSAQAVRQEAEGRRSQLRRRPRRLRLRRERSPSRTPTSSSDERRPQGKIIIDGNAACGMGAVFAGVTVVAWYPITPSSFVVEASSTT